MINHRGLGSGHSPQYGMSPTGGKLGALRYSVEIAQLGGGVRLSHTSTRGGAYQTRARGFVIDADRGVMMRSEGAVLE